MKNLFKYIMIAGLAIGFVACDDEVDVDVQSMKTEALAGQWEITISKDGAVEDHATVNTYNTAEDSDNSIFVWDDDNDIRIKVNANVETLTFSGENAVNVLDTDQTFTLTEGQILEGKATTPGGNVSDSIRFVLSDGTDTYEYAGYRFTGFEEDSSH